MLRSSQRLNLLVSELQEGVMKTRMQPIDTVWNKLPRVIRDLGVSCGKDVRIELVVGGSSPVSVTSDEPLDESAVAAAVAEAGYALTPGRSLL